MSIDSYLRRLQMRATAAEPTLPKILAAKKPAPVPEDEDVADEDVDDSAGDEDISFDDFMDEAGIDANEDSGEDDAEPDSEDGDTEAEPDMDVDSLTHAEEPVPKKPLPKPGKPGKAKPAVPAKQPAPVAQVAPPADMAENLPQPDQAVSDMDAAVKAAQRERSALEAKQQQQQQQAVAPVTSASVSSMRGVCDAMTQAGFKFALVNLQRDLLSTMEDNGLINEAKKIAGIDPERLTNLTAQFIPAGRLIPALYQLGWKPVHKTGINENYPKNERYELTMSNGVMFITVRGTYDWSVMQTSTVIRYATDSELRRYGLLREVDDTMMEAQASKIGRIAQVPSRAWYGVAASRYPTIQEGIDTQLCMNGAFLPDGCNMRSGDNVALRNDSGFLPAVVHGLLQTSKMEVPVAWCMLQDGYALVPVDQVFRGCV